MARAYIRKASWAALTLAAVAGAGYLARDGLAGVAAVKNDVEVAERAAQPVRVTRVAFAPLTAVESYTGTIRPQHEAPLGFRQPGKLTLRLVDVGDVVTAGQVVARLDDTDARLELQVAEAELAAATTDLARATADLSRSLGLFAEGHVAQAALDRATSAKAEAHARADRAVQARSLAANQLSYMDLLAEADGIVTATPAEAGQVVAAGQPVVSVAMSGAVDVVFALPEQRRDLLKSAVATAELWGAAGNSYALALRDISPDADPVGRTYRVRMRLTTPDGETALGRTVTVRLTTSDAAPVAALPLAAVLNDGTGAAVWRLPQGGNVVERVPVELVAVEGHVAEVRGALAEGDTVVSLGAHKIDASRPVRVVETTPTPES